jgi:hypothetical protein
MPPNRKMPDANFAMQVATTAQRQLRSRQAARRSAAGPG